MFDGFLYFGRQMAAVITEDNVYREAELQDVPPADHQDEVQLPEPEGNIQGQVMLRYH